MSAAETVRQDRQRTNDDLCTPPEILDPLRVVMGEIVLDPCSNPWSTVGARVELDGSEGRDGLAADWRALAGGGLIFVNPPYGRGHLARWAAKIAAEADAGAEIVALVPCSPDTRWWRTLAADAEAIVYVHGRLRFRGGSHGAGTFPSALIYRAGDVDRRYLFAHAFRHLGDVRVRDR